MTTTQDEFSSFRQKYYIWHGHTEELPFRNGFRTPQNAFELDLDHLIDYIRPVLVAATGNSTQFEYPKVADEYLSDLDRLTPELESTSLSDAERQAYAEYLAEFRLLLRSLGSLSVPWEGHLGFRKCAVQSFQFLADEYGFTVVESSPIAVRFAAHDLFVNLSYSPECPMDSVLIGVRVDDESLVSGFILDDFAYVDGQGVLFDYARFNLRTPEGTAEFLETAARLVHSHGAFVLQGNPDALREFQNKADEREQLYVEMMERQSARH